MDIQEAREAFERRRANALNVSYEGLKANFDENSRLFGTRYNAGSINEKEWNLWLEAWQAKAQAVPEGFVLVPKEPTDKTIARMINTPIEVNLLCDHADIFLSEGEAYIAYQAMVEAQEPAND